MAKPTDVNFGKSFNADIVRSALTSAMEMGSANQNTDKVTFRWNVQRSYDTSSVAVDASGKPFSFESTPSTVSEKEDVQIPVAVTFIEHQPRGTALGQMDNPRIELTVLDTYYPSVSTADKVLIGGNEYIIDFWKVDGLFDMDVWTCFVHATDET